HNCIWLLGYPHQVLSGGSMYAVQLPPVIPAVGVPGGPPLPANYHQFANTPYPGDIRLMWLTCIRDPNQLQPTWERMIANFTEAQKKQKEAKAGK
ncbi:MAG: hypothetical protein ACRD3S_19115, partial [Terracidiphilus sp.]